MKLSVLTQIVFIIHSEVYEIMLKYNEQEAHELFLYPG